LKLSSSREKARSKDQIILDLASKKKKRKATPQSSEIATYFPIQKNDTTRAIASTMYYCDGKRFISTLLLSSISILSSYEA